MEIQYRALALSQCGRIRELDASQYIGRAWREVGGKRQLVEIQYADPDFPNGFESHLAALEAVVRSGGIALGAFFEERLVGFCSVDMTPFGESCRYVLLDQLFVTRQLRGKGIGRTLFLHAARRAREQGADRFYICAGSAEETVAFYAALGCREAAQISKALYARDPRDLQLEFDFRKL